MRNLKIQFLAVVALVLFAGTAFATPTPTPSATPTATSTPAYPAPTASPVPTPILNARTTNFGFIGPDATSNGIYGGRIVRLVATAALALACPVTADPNHSDQVIQAGIGTTAPIGVVIGSSGSASVNLVPGIGIPPVASQKAIVQINGIVNVACDSSIASGTALMPSSTVGCAVGPYVAGTVDQEIGIALKSCAANGFTDMLIIK
jgi:hypothetical protein